MTVQLPPGFKAGAVAAGIKPSKKIDLALLTCPPGSIAGAVFTLNRFPAACVIRGRSLRPMTNLGAIIVNAGNANAATGKLGLERDAAMAAAVAQALGLQANQVFTSSTGVIGQQLPLEKVQAAMPALVSSLNSDAEGFSQAILTTDLKPKLVAKEVVIQGKAYKVVGAAKGSGMIEPNMGTMLGYLMTDAPLAPSLIQALTEEITNRSFNCVSVDSDTSTNDSFFLISSNPQEGPLAPELKAALQEAAIELAKMIAADGEGAQHLVEVQITQAQDQDQAHRVMKAILNSPLVKTAIHGRDPNWGRLMMAVGKSIGDMGDNLPINIWLQQVPVFQKGEPQPFDKPSLSKKLGEFEVLIQVELGLGQAKATGWGCDLSKDYISINAEYTT